MLATVDLGGLPMVKKGCSYEEEMVDLVSDIIERGMW